MKKFCLLLLSAISMLAVSCESSSTPSSKVDLVGTTWSASEPFEMEGYELTFKLSLSFISTDAFTMTAEADAGLLSSILGDLYNESYEGTWEYEEPTVYFTIEGQSLTGTIDGDELTVVFEGEPYTLTKQ